MENDDVIPEEAAALETEMAQMHLGDI